MPSPASFAMRKMRVRFSPPRDAATRTSSSTRTDLSAGSRKLRLPDPELVEEPGLIEGRDFGETLPLPSDVLRVALEKRLPEGTPAPELAREPPGWGALDERENPGVLGPAVLHDLTAMGIPPEETDARIADHLAAREPDPQRKIEDGRGAAFDGRIEATQSREASPVDEESPERRAQALFGAILDRRGNRALDDPGWMPPVPDSLEPESEPSGLGNRVGKDVARDQDCPFVGLEGFDDLLDPVRAHGPRSGLEEGAVRRCRGGGPQVLCHAAAERPRKRQGLRTSPARSQEAGRFRQLRRARSADDDELPVPVRGLFEDRADRLEKRTGSAPG